MQVSEEDLRSNTPPGGFGISKLVRSRSSISLLRRAAFLFTDPLPPRHCPSFTLLTSATTTLHQQPNFLQKFLLDANLFSLPLCVEPGGVQLSAVSTLGRVVAHWRGLSRVARVSPCAAQPGTAGGGPAPARPRLGTSTALVATLVTQGRGQWGSHWRRHGQRRRLWRLRQASPAGDPAAPALLDISLVLVASVTSVYGGRPTQLSPHLTRLLPGHPERARWRKLHSFRQEDL